MIAKRVVAYPLDDFEKEILPESPEWGEVFGMMYDTSAKWAFQQVVEGNGQKVCENVYNVVLDVEDGYEIFWQVEIAV